MTNTSVNTSAVPVEFMYCMKEIPIGFMWLYVAMSLCFLLGTPAHSWLLWLSLRAGWKIKPTQMFPLILTTIDLLFCIHLPFQILNTFIFLNTTLSSVSLFVFGLCWGSRLLIQVCVCIEQYLAVVYPITFLRYKAIQYRIAAAVTVWLMSSGYGLLQISAALTFPDYVFSSFCFIGLFVISFCCMSVLRALRHPGPGGRETTKERGRDVGNQQKRNAFIAISTILLTVLISYLPLALIAICHLTYIYKGLFYCNINFVMISFYVYCVMVQPLQKLYKEGHMKCISNQKANQSG